MKLSAISDIFDDLQLRYFQVLSFKVMNNLRPSNNFLSINFFVS